MRVAQPDNDRDIDVVEQIARLEHRRVAFLYDVAGPAHRRRGVLVDDLADDELVERGRDEVVLDEIERIVI